MSEARVPGAQRLCLSGSIGSSMQSVTVPSVCGRE